MAVPIHGISDWNVEANRPEMCAALGREYGGNVDSVAELYKKPRHQKRNKYNGYYLRR